MKRVDLLITAFLHIARSRPDWDLVIIGDGPLRCELEAQIPDELHHRVIWTGFLDDQAVISAIYKCCDVLVLPSDYEPWALVILEAVAAGLAVVSSSAVGASPEVVEEGVNGLVFAPGDQSALSYCLMLITQDDRVDQFKRATTEVLKRWQAKSDPIAGLRQALLRFGSISDDG